MESLDDLLLLTLTPGLGPVRIGRGLIALGSARAMAQAGADALASALGMSPLQAQGMIRSMREVAAADVVAEERRLAAELGVTLVAWDDPSYPRLLKLIADPPPLLYVKGAVTEQDALALAMVGSRKCSHYGREQADRFAAGCAMAGLCIVSGGAYGVDTAAHRAALRVGGRTLAVIGSGLAQPYPPDNHELFDAIARQGAVISELPMRTAPRPENFPSRNRIISGLSLGVLVVEAALRSGALITARLAAEDHAREVMALPGRVDSPTSAGCHRILREGWASLVTSPAEVMQSLGEAGQTLAASQSSGDADAPPTAPAMTLTPSQRTIFDHLQSPATLDDLATVAGLPIATLRADLTLLEIRGLVRRQGVMLSRVQPK
ncbi:MAG: DNA-protecting protein DprA [Phycisphaeraceae bacterium]|nr:DNA-protecting protein DprA [Phycisphaeraceae bacterium]